MKAATATAKKRAKTYSQLQGEYSAMIWDLARRADAGYRKNQCSTRLYLVGEKRVDGVWDKLDVADETDERPRVIGDWLKWNFTVEQLAEQIRKMLAREPLAFWADQ